MFPQTDGFRMCFRKQRKLSKSVDMFTDTDDRFLVKPAKSVIKLMPNAEYELPYEGAKKMLLVNDVDNKDFLEELFNAMYEELPAPKSF